MQNGALQDYPLDEDDLENFYIRNLSRFVMVTLGSQGLPRSSQGLPRGIPFTFNLKLTFKKIYVKIISC